MSNECAVDPLTPASTVSLPLGGRVLGVRVRPTRGSNLWDISQEISWRSTVEQ